MGHPVDLVEIWRGDMVESIHQGHAIVCDAAGDIVHSWGDPAAVIYPRSSCKMLQALPLVESGAADAHGLTSQQLALACASHRGERIHTDPVSAWLETLNLTDDDYRCGPQMPTDRATRTAMIKDDVTPCQIHNNCSGKHAGFLTLNAHLGGDAEYVDPQHPVQVAAKAAFEDVTAETSPRFAIDGCSAPNFATTMHGLGRAMAKFASAGQRSDTRSRAMVRLAQAMASHPAMVAGSDGACTHLMQATEGRVTVKGGAEGVYVAIVPEKQMGVALKIADGASRASECAIASILVRLGVLDPAHPLAQRYVKPAITNRRGLVTGQMQPAAALQ